MTAAKLLMSLVTRAVAIEKAAISVARRREHDAESQHPQPVHLEPDGDADGDDDGVEDQHHHESREDRPDEDGEPARRESPESVR